MKKKVSILLSVLLILTIALVGCGKKGSALDDTTWKLTGGKEASTGLELTADQLATVGMSDFTLELKAGGVLNASLAGESSEGTWSEKDGSVTISLDGDEITTTVKDNIMTWEDPSMTLTFEKQ